MSTTIDWSSQTYSPASSIRPVKCGDRVVQFKGGSASSKIRVSVYSYDSGTGVVTQGKWLSANDSPTNIDQNYFSVIPFPYQPRSVLIVGGVNASNVAVLNTWVVQFDATFTSATWTANTALPSGASVSTRENSGAKLGATDTTGYFYYNCGDSSGTGFLARVAALDGSNNTLTWYAATSSYLGGVSGFLPYGSEYIIGVNAASDYAVLFSGGSSGVSLHPVSSTGYLSGYPNWPSGGVSYGFSWDVLSDGTITLTRNSGNSYYASSDPDWSVYKVEISGDASNFSEVMSFAFTKIGAPPIDYQDGASFNRYGPLGLVSLSDDTLLRVGSSYVFHGEIVSTGVFDAALSSTCTLEATLSDLNLNADLISVASITANLSIPSNFEVLLYSQSILDATLTDYSPTPRPVRFRADLYSQSALSASLSTQKRFAAALSSESVLSATMQTGVMLSADLASASTVTANLSAPVIFRVDLKSQSDMGADLSTQIRLAANLICRSDVSAFLSIPGKQKTDECFVYTSRNDLHVKVARYG